MGKLTILLLTVTFLLSACAGKTPFERLTETRRPVTKAFLGRIFDYRQLAEAIKAYEKQVRTLADEAKYQWTSDDTLLFTNLSQVAQAADDG